MSLDRVTVSRSVLRPQSSNSKPSVPTSAWNMIEAGDHYDIRRSLIAKLPGTKVAMHEHIEIVCLFQAVEIERLTANLEEFRVKYKEMEKRELDRHSYEVQIMELAQKLAEYEGFRSENAKLKDLIHRQTQEIQDLRKKSEQIQPNHNMEHLQAKYDSCLKQLEVVYKENALLKDDKNKIMSQVLYLRELADKLHHNNNLQGEEISRCKAEISRLQKELEKSQEAENLREEFGRIIQQKQMEIQKLREQLNQHNQQEVWTARIQAVVDDYESHLAGLVQELERLSQLLYEKDQEIRRLNLNCSRVEGQLRRSQQTGAQLLKQKAVYEQQLDKLRQNLSGFMQIENQVKLYKAKVEQSQRNSSLLLKQLQTNREASRKLPSALKDIQQLSANLKDKDKLVLNLSKQNQQLQRQLSDTRKIIAELERSKSTLTLQLSQQKTKLETSNSRIASLGKQYDQKILMLSKTISEYQEKLALLSQEIQRLQATNSSIQAKLKASQQSLQVKVVSYTALETRFRQINQQHVKIVRQLQISEANKQTLEQANKAFVNKLEQTEKRTKLELNAQKEQFEKIRDGLNSRIEYEASQKQELSQQLGLSRIRLTELQTNISRLQEELRTSKLQSAQLLKQAEFDRDSLKSNYELRIKTLDQDKTQLKTKLSTLEVTHNRLISENRSTFSQTEVRITQFQLTIAQLRKETTTLTEKLRLREQQLHQLETRTFKSNYEKDQLTSNIHQFQKRIAQILENQKKTEALWNQALSDCNKRNSEYVLKIGTMAQEIQRLNNQLKKKTEVQAKSAQHVQEIQKLKSVLQVKLQECKRLQTDYTELSEKTAAGTEQSGLDVQQRILQHTQRFTELQREFELVTQNLSLIQTQNHILRQENYQLQSYPTNIGVLQLENKNRFMAAQIQRLLHWIEQLNRQMLGLRLEHDDTPIRRRLDSSASLSIRRSEIIVGEPVRNLISF